MASKRKNGVEKPRAEDFSQEVIRKSVASEAIQHPTTLFPAAASILSGLYMALVSANETAFALCLGSGLVSLVSYVYHYFVRGEKIAEKHVQELLARRKEFKEQRGDTIEQRCRDERFPEGAQASRELKQAYSRLDSYLEEKYSDQKSLTAQRFRVLAEETFYQGVQFLEKALSLHSALRQMDDRKLQQELRTWERELSGLEKKKDYEAGHREILEKALRDKIRSHKKRLDLYDRRKKTLDQVLAQCEILEATLDSTYLEVVDLIEGGAQLKRNNVAGNLEKAVAAARRVEDRLRGLGREQEEEDRIYGEYDGQ